MVAEGKQEDILTRRWDGGGGNGAPITARRYLSFTVPGGDDDMFSSDLTDAELRVRCHLRCSYFCCISASSLTQVKRRHLPQVSGWAWKQRGRAMRSIESATA